MAVTVVVLLHIVQAADLVRRAEQYANPLSRKSDSLRNLLRAAREMKRKEKAAFLFSSDVCLFPFHLFPFGIPSTTRANRHAHTHAHTHMTQYGICSNQARVFSHLTGWFPTVFLLELLTLFTDSSLRIGYTINIYESSMMMLFGNELIVVTRRRKEGYLVGDREIAKR